VHCDLVKTTGRVSYARRCGARPGLNERGLGDRGTGDFRWAVGVLVRSLPAPVDPTRSDGDFGDFIYALYAEYVARHGCTAEDLEFSLSALRKITTRFSAEFAIRPFLNLFPDQVLAILQIWTEDEHRRVRRLCNEHATAAPMRSEADAALRRRHPAPRPALRGPHALRHLVRSQPHQRHLQEGPAPRARHPRTVARLRAPAAARDGYVIRHAARTLVRADHPSRARSGQFIYRRRATGARGRSAEHMTRRGGAGCRPLGDGC
jgi:3-methyladenine DNA glycosylase AlkC